jgi:hypothetical protein
MGVYLSRPSDDRIFDDFILTYCKKGPGLHVPYDSFMAALFSYLVNVDYPFECSGCCIQDTLKDMVDYVIKRHKIKVSGLRLTHARVLIGIDLIEYPTN